MGSGLEPSSSDRVRVAGGVGALERGLGWSERRVNETVGSGYSTGTPCESPKIESKVGLGPTSPSSDTAQSSRSLSARDSGLQRHSLGKMH